MRIVVVGGTGLIGSKLVNKLRECGHEAVAAAPNTGVNSITGEGLAEALKGASAVVDVTNSPSWEDAAVLKFFETSTRNLLANEAAAGVGHHVALSVVGTDRLVESGFFRAKLHSLHDRPRDAVLRVRKADRRFFHGGQRGTTAPRALPAYGGRGCSECIGRNRNELTRERYC